MRMKTIFLSFIVCLSMTLICEAGDFSYFDRVTIGNAWSSNISETYIATNIVTYNGEAWDGKLKLVELSLDIGLLDYQKIDFNNFNLGKNVKPILDVSINIVETGKLVPVVDYVAKLIPNWIYVGTGIGAHYENDEIGVRGKVIAAVKVDI